MAQDEKQVFAFAIDDENALSLSMTRDMRSGLRFCGNGMKDVNATDSSTLDERTKRAGNGFHFRKFGHGCSTGSRSRLESERVFSSPLFSSIAERRENGFPLVPIGKLIGVMAATRLARLPGGEGHNGFIPVFGISAEAHRRAVSFRGGAHPILRSGFGLVGDAKKGL